MIRMATDDALHAKQVKVTDHTDQALKRVVAEMRRVRIGRSLMTEERLINASWLWLETMDAAALEGALLPHLKRYEAIRAGKPDPGLAPDRAPGVARARRRAKPVAGYRVRSASEREADDLKPAAPKRDRGIKRPEG